MEKPDEISADSDDEARLRDDVEQSERVLKILQRDLREIDGELDELAKRTHQYDLVSEICSSLENLEEIGAADLFGDQANEQDSADRLRYARKKIAAFGDDIAITFVDLTDGKAKEQKMESIAASDPLTGVLNRRGFERDASKRLRDSADDATGALLFIDLNDFKTINDTFGHEIGDQLTIDGDLQIFSSTFDAVLVPF